MEIKILGSGSKGNCYRVSDGESAVLLECGLPFSQIQKGLNFKVAELAACLITHEHGDHAKSVRDMMKAGVDCCMSAGTARALGFADDATRHRLMLLQYPVLYAIGGFHVLPFATKHDGAEPMGFFIQSDMTGERLLYVTDTCYVPNRFEGLTQIMIEVNYCKDVLDENVKNGTVDHGLRNRIVKSHMSLETALNFFAANDLSQVNEIVLLHLSDNNSDAERILSEVKKATGKVVKIA